MAVVGTVGDVGDQVSRIAVYVAYMLSVLVVLAGLAWGLGGYLLEGDTSFPAEALSYGLVTLAMTWLGVFVVFVIAKAFRVGAQL
jgi:hypothetical protein